MQGHLTGPPLWVWSGGGLIGGDGGELMVAKFG
jgi:hypothetical protein